MFSKRNRGPVPVQVVGTHPITKLEYYSKHGRNWFIALLVLSVIALVLGALIVSGVIAYKVNYEYQVNDLYDAIFGQNPGANGMDDLRYAFLLFLEKLGNGNLEDGINNFLGLATVKPMSVDNAAITEIVHVNSKQATLDLIGQWALVVSTITLVLSIIGIGAFSYLYKFDKPVSTKKEQKFYRQLEKAEYKAAIKTQKINKAKANKELKANLKADFKSKKVK